MWTLLLTLLAAYQSYAAIPDYYTAAVVEFASPLYSNYTADEVMLANAAIFAGYMYNASLSKADIIVFPEGGLHGQNWAASIELPSPSEKANPCNDPNKFHKALVLLSCATRKFNIYAVVNTGEKYDNSTSNKTEYYNSNVAFDRNGTVVARYRKFNPYGEPVNKPALDLDTFYTDFGVTFGMFTCFDINFMEPGVILARDYGVKHFAFPHCWISELPFLTAIQAQWGFAYSLDTVLLAAGCNAPDRGGTGSGIYHGRRGALEYFQTNDHTSRLIIANVSKSFEPQSKAVSAQGKAETASYKEPARDVLPDDKDPEVHLLDDKQTKSSLFLLRDYTDVYKSQALFPSRYSPSSLPYSPLQSSLFLLRDYTDVYKSQALFPSRYSPSSLPYSPLQSSLFLLRDYTDVYKSQALFPSRYSPSSLPYSPLQSSLFLLRDYTDVYKSQALFPSRYSPSSLPYSPLQSSLFLLRDYTDVYKSQALFPSRYSPSSLPYSPLQSSLFLLRDYTDVYKSQALFPSRYSPSSLPYSPLQSSLFLLRDYTDVYKSQALFPSRYSPSSLPYSPLQSSLFLLRDYTDVYKSQALFPSRYSPSSLPYSPLQSSLFLLRDYTDVYKSQALFPSRYSPSSLPYSPLQSSLFLLRDYTDVYKSQALFPSRYSPSSLPYSPLQSSLFLLRDYTDVYKSQALFPSRYSPSSLPYSPLQNSSIAGSLTTETTICQGTLCCDFKVKVTSSFNATPPTPTTRGDDFTRQFYRLVAFDGVRWYGGGLATGGVQICGVISCANQSISSCGLRSDDPAAQTATYGQLFKVGTVFESVSITGLFGYNKTFVYPDILTTATGDKFGALVSPNVFTYVAFAPHNGTVLASLTLDTPVSNLVTAAIYARQFDRDGEKRTELPAVSFAHPPPQSVFMLCVLFLLFFNCIFSWSN